MNKPNQNPLKIGNVEWFQLNPQDYTNSNFEVEQSTRKILNALRARPGIFTSNKYRKMWSHGQGGEGPAICSS